MKKEKTFIILFMNIMFGSIAAAGQDENFTAVNSRNAPYTSSFSSLSTRNITTTTDIENQIDQYNRYIDTPAMRELYSKYKEAQKQFEALVPTEFKTLIKEYMEFLDKDKNISTEQLNDYKNELDEQFRFLELIINALENTQLSSYAEVMRLKEILSEETDPILRMAKIRKEIVFSVFDNSRIDEFFTRRNRDPIFKVDPFFIERINKPLTNDGPVGSVTDRLTDDEFKLDLFKKNLPDDVKTKMTELNNKYCSSYNYSLSYSVKLVHLALYNRMIEAKKKLDDHNRKLFK